jgi:F420-0:gamma-glutamyl ligase-like protein
MIETEMMDNFKPNTGKNIAIETENGTYLRYPVRTSLVVKEDKLTDILDTFVKEYLEGNDIVYIAEKIVAITQGRAFPVDEIKPSGLAKFMSKFVFKSSYGIGIGSPVTMELCLRDVGRVKVVFAAIIAAICKLFGKRGVFYNICGYRARAIDGPCDFTIPPYNNYAKLAPENPEKVAKELSEYLSGYAGNITVVIIDANDIGVNILGMYPKEIPEPLIEAIFSDNPLDQADQQTPVAIVRKAEAPAESLPEADDKNLPEADDESLQE